jgi:hypothetical protein
MAFDYERGLRIDKHDLDTEIIAQPQRFFEVAEEATRLKSVEDATKANLETVTAKRSLAIRSQLEEAGEKVTEEKVKMMLASDKYRREAAQALLEARAEADRQSALREAWSQRSWMLRDLAGLFAAGYFSQAAVRGEASREVADASIEKTRERVAKKRRRISG